ncbi:DUF2924 domain-containing protein [Planctomicrobium sp. SH661]|uniref:DUF2924 domain-containing protein n=1 Tax=Planctomicrobium sp. SH661 TaxID=3448124 RepID=UPI003F5B4FFF
MNVEEDLAALQEMTTDELRERYAEIFGEEPRSRHKAYLIRKIAWRIQAEAEGDLSERARRRAAELAVDAEVRTTPPRTRSERSANKPRTLKKVEVSRDPRLPAPGTAITRKYKGRTLEVRVQRDGFEYEGERYKTLSAVAKAITGSHCNGFRFFKLAEDK